MAVSARGQGVAVGTRGDPVAQPRHVACRDGGLQRCQLLGIGGIGLDLLDAGQGGLAVRTGLAGLDIVTQPFKVAPLDKAGKAAVFLFEGAGGGLQAGQGGLGLVPVGAEHAAVEIDGQPVLIRGGPGNAGPDLVLDPGQGGAAVDLGQPGLQPLGGGAVAAAVEVGADRRGILCAREELGLEFLDGQGFLLGGDIDRAVMEQRRVVAIVEHHRIGARAAFAARDAIAQHPAGEGFGLGKAGLAVGIAEGGPVGDAAQKRQAHVAPERRGAICPGVGAGHQQHPHGKAGARQHLAHRPDAAGEQTLGIRHHRQREAAPGRAEALGQGGDTLGEGRGRQAFIAEADREHRAAVLGAKGEGGFQRQPGKLCRRRKPALGCLGPGDGRDGAALQQRRGDQLADRVGPGQVVDGVIEDPLGLGGGQRLAKADQRRAARRAALFGQRDDAGAGRTGQKRKTGSEGELTQTEGPAPERAGGVLANGRHQWHLFNLPSGPGRAPERAIPGPAAGRNASRHRCRPAIRSRRSLRFPTCTPPAGADNCPGNNR
ncbi:hypothetical protein [Oceanicola sp. S124]|uniref:hypothetical protein n=1 Tax=Oceanicola sp. S124 TaxID=1042378 RepID=UPI0002FA2ACB|nr:hypothetical protein [Oceanicola sp. S124]